MIPPPKADHSKTTNGDEVYELARPHDKAWWKSAVVYQIWPTSFKDSNGDGIGDLKGIESKVDYLVDLGINVLWLSPIFKSPLVDMGYDISDYTDIDPRFGTVQDVSSLAAALHAKDCKLVLDLVVNHTSDKHAWFEESRSSKTNPKRDWYIWRPAKVGPKGERQPPNNWTAAFGGSVWEWCDITEEYYLHYFCPEQPDLNWENPDVRQAVWSVMKFWLDRGVDGFRMDVINMISKHLDFPDAEIVDPTQFIQPGGGQYMVNGPRIHEFLQEMYREVNSKYDVLTVGEIPGTNQAAEMLKYVHKDRKELQMGFDFAIVGLDRDAYNFDVPPAWTLAEFKEVVEHWSVGMYDGGWWAIYLENHDQCRSISRWANASPEYRVQSGKMLALMQLSSFGTPYIYQGQELGMINLPLDFPEDELKDVRTVNMLKNIAERGGSRKDELSQHVRERARDNARSPMQWTSGAHGGFTEGEPWMKLNPDYIKCNVEHQLADSASVRAFFQKMIKLRKEMEVLVYGKFELLSGHNHDEDVFAYTRTIATPSGAFETVLVALNFSTKKLVYEIKTEGHHSIIGDLKNAGLVIGTHDDAEKSFKNGTVMLRAYEGVMYKL